MEPLYELDSPNGPRVLFPASADEPDFSECPAGWRIDFDSQVRTRSGLWSAPLVEDV